MARRKYVLENAKLGKRDADGSYPLILITEGEGSSGRYSAELMDNSEHVFEGVPSFANHPIDPQRPHERDVNSIVGRVYGVAAEDGKLKDGTPVRQLAGRLKPRAEYVEFLEEFGDIVGFSIYCGLAEGMELDDGRFDVHEFDAEDPYRSVDLVVAAGRGGRIKRAGESLRAIESSLGKPAGKTPGSTSAPGSEKEGTMLEKEDLEAIAKAIAEALAPVLTFVTEQKAAAEGAQKQAEADADAGADTDKLVADAVEAYAAKVDAIAKEELFDSQKASLLESAKKGEDISSALESAKQVVTEAKAARSVEDAYVFGSKSAEPTDGAVDFAVEGLI